jgi:hypothetical protein
MAASLADLKIVHSGGAANVDPDLDLGGAISTAGTKDILSQTSTALTTITGVTIDDAAGNTEGAGTLFFDSTASTLRWTPFNGTAGNAIDVSVNGAYALQGGNNGGLLKVTVVSGTLPSSDQTNTSTIANIANNMFDDVAKADAKAGDTNYRGVYWENDHASDSMVDIRMWIETNTQGQDVVQIAIANEAVNVTMATIANEATDPALTIDFDDTNPIDYDSGIIIPDLTFGSFQGWWLKRTVPAGTNQSQTNNSFRIGVRIFV